MIPAGWVPELWRMVHRSYSHIGGPRILMFLEAYCDESADENQQRVLLVAGLVGMAESWNCVWGEWDRALAEADPPLKEFHAVDCEQGHGEFNGRNDRPELYAKFLKILTNPENKIWGISSAVWLPAYNKRLAEIKALRVIHKDKRWKGISGTLENPYFLLFQHTIELADRVTANLPPDEKIMFTFDQHHLEKRARAIYESFRGTTWPYEWPRRASDDLHFRTSEVCKPLQAADLLAYEMRRYLDEVHYGGQPERPHMEAIYQIIKSENARLFKEDSVDELIKIMERQEAARKEATENLEFLRVLKRASDDAASQQRPSEPS